MAHDVSDKQLVRIDWDPSAASLRSFGAAMLVVLVGGVLSRRGHSPDLGLLYDPVSVAAGVLALFAALLAAFRPTSLRPAYVTVGVATYPARWLIAALSLALLYYGVITPIAISMRCVRKHRAHADARSAGSAWVISQPRPDKANYFRQF
jgi:hypothetical protein